MTNNDEPETTKADRIALLQAEIAVWAAAQKAERQQLCIDRLAIGDGFERKKSLSNAVLDQVAQFYRTNGKADCAPGLIAVVGLLSDNAACACSLSIRRLSDILNRSPESIRDALGRLVELGIVATEDREGDTHLLWLRTAAAVAGAHHLWLVDAYSNPPRPRGRQPKPLRVDPHGFAVEVEAKPLRAEQEGFAFDEGSKPLRADPEGLKKTPAGGAEKPLRVHPQTSSHIIHTPSNHRRRRGLPQEVEEAFDFFCSEAKAHGYEVPNAFTADRRKRLEDRVRDIGGLEAFKASVRAIQHDEFLAGRKTDFRMTLERLLSTRSGMGDVLARLYDLAVAQRPPTTPQKASDLPDRWFEIPALREHYSSRPDLLRSHLVGLNGHWPANLGPPPGARGCAIPQSLVDELKLERFAANALTT